MGNCPHRPNKPEDMSLLYRSLRTSLAVCTALSVLLFSACKQTAPEEQADEDPLAHLDTPEDVVRQYQSFMDSSKFDKAKLLSTPKGADLMDALASAFADEPLDSSILHTVFLELNCTERGDSAFCACKLKDEYETYDARFTLIKLDGRWLVDPPDEEADESLEFSEEWLEGEFEPGKVKDQKDNKQ